MARVSGIQTAQSGQCLVCGKRWFTKNILGLASIHAMKKGHASSVEITVKYEIKP